MFQSFDALGIKHSYIVSGENAKLEIANRGLEYDPSNDKVFVELSWGSGDDEEFDFAVSATGLSIDAAICKCAETFNTCLLDNDNSAWGIAAIQKKYGSEIGNWINRCQSYKVFSQSQF